MTDRVARQALKHFTFTFFPPLIITMCDNVRTRMVCHHITDRSDQWHTHTHTLHVWRCDFCAALIETFLSSTPLTVSVCNLHRTIRLPMDMIIYYYSHHDRIAAKMEHFSADTREFPLAGRSGCVSALSDCPTINCACVFYYLDMHRIALASACMCVCEESEDTTYSILFRIPRWAAIYWSRHTRTHVSEWGRPACVTNPDSREHNYDNA